jgi:hypothetical protein
MAAGQVIWSQPMPLNVAASGGFDLARNSIWLAGTDGRCAAFRVYDRSIQVEGSGYTDPIAVVPLADGLQVAVVQRDGVVWAADRQRPDQRHARLIWTSPDGAVAATSGPDGHLLVLTDAAAVVSLDPGTGTVEVVVADAGEAVALAVDEQFTTTLLLGPAPGGGGTDAVLRRVTLATGDVVDVVVAAAAPAAVVSAPIGAAGALIADGPDVLLVATGGATGTVVTLPGPVLGLARWGSLVLAASAGALHAIEWDLDPGKLSMSVEPGLLVCSGWSTVLFDPGTLGLAATDLELLVVEGADAGTVSAGIEAPDAAGNLRVALLAGFRTGEFTLRAYATATGDVLGSARFRVSDYWPDEDTGPPIAVTGEQVTFATGSWGGSGGAGPQNIPPQAAAENWRVAIVLVDTRGSVPPAVATSAAWVDRLIGTNTSARTYYEEISFYDAAAPVGTRTGTTISQSGGVFGPMKIDMAWGELFDPIDKSQPWRGWDPKSTTWQLVAGEFCDWLSAQPGDPRAAVLSSTDAILFVFRCASTGPVMVGKDTLPAEYVWPQAHGAQVSWNSPTTYTEISMPIVLMPDGFPTGIPADQKQFEPTPALCHELGHTLGLDDLYNANKLFTAEVTDRIATDLDLMCSSGALPDMSLANRMRLGWIRPQWVEAVDFAANPAARTIALRSVETTGPSGPPPGVRTGIEVRIRDGWNYYFEHRHRIGTQVGDRNLTNVLGTPIPDGRLVLGTDVLRPSVGEPKRPSILLLAKDADGDGPVLFTPGTDYQETDTSNPGRAFDFTLRYLGVDPVDSEVVHVSLEHIEARRPQLQISPAPGGTDFKSPDIDLVGPGGANALVKGAPHTVLARVRNVGNVDATDVLVHLKWLPFTTSAGAWNGLPDPPRQTIPAGATRTFSVNWTPPASLKIGEDEVDHFCIRVDVDRYIDSVDPRHSEITISDNWAQSNFDATSASFNSPSVRIRTAFEMTNTLADPAVFTTHVAQTSPWYRTYVGQAWQRLQPGERRGVTLMYESLAGDVQQGRAFADAYEYRRLEEPNRMAITSRVVTQDYSQCASSRPWWGAALQMRVARRCWFEDIVHSGELVSAVVMGGEPDGGYGPIADGTVTLALWDERGDTFQIAGTTDANGHARVLLGHAVLDLLAGGVELQAILVRPETYSYARAVSKAFPLTLDR